jgi:hypothetical protein
MSDIDFDELDRAVNGALGGTPAPRPAADITPVQKPEQPSVPTFERVERTTIATAVTPTSVPAAEPVSSVNPPPVSVAPAARRSSGRFMDMVHPSSDMRSRTDEAAAEAKQKRSFTSPAPAPFQASTPAVQPVVAAPEIIETSAWNEPLESPFLPDAKVEKRPLGGGDVQSTAEGTSPLSGFDFQGLLDEPDEPLLEAPEPQERLEATTLPDPIDFAHATAKAQAPVAETAQPEAVAIETPEVAPMEPEIIPETPRPVETVPQPIVEQPTGPSSITQQYKEHPSTTQESGAIFDTESYHQAVVQPVKKKSGWLTVLLILLLVVLGAAGGWAVYVYVLPML